MKKRNFRLELIAFVTLVLLLGCLVKASFAYDYCIVIPDAHVQDLVNSFAVAYNYQAEIDDPANPGQKIPNPQTKAQFARSKVVQFIKEIYVYGQTQIDIQDAAQALKDAASAEIDSAN